MELLDRVVKALTDKGYKPLSVQYHVTGEKVGNRSIDVHETQRINHRKLDNVTVTIDVNEWNGCTGHRIARIKVPKDASDRVLNNRVEQAIAVYNG